MVGYTARGNGTWRSDPIVRRLIRRLMVEKYHELGSVGAVHLYLRQAFSEKVMRRLAAASEKKKLAIVYLRTSATRGDTQTTKRSLMSRLIRLGWKRDRILVIDDGDVSGRSRGGFLRMVRLIGAGRVGIIGVNDISRISRDPVQLSEFFAKARAGSIPVLTRDGLAG